MNAVDMIKGRRSIRKYLDQKVDRKLMEEIIEIARFAPSWANYQIARYSLIDDGKIIERLSKEGVNGFVYNIDTLKNAKGVAIISFVKGKSGKLDPNADYATNKNNVWEVFDAGIACQTFCLAAHAKGVGTCIMGVIDEKSIAKIIDLPKDETVAAIIVYGLPNGEVASSSRKPVSEICRFID